MIFNFLAFDREIRFPIIFYNDIRDKGFFKTGSITITQISETEVKTQFLEGRSEQNFNDSFDDIYLNQLNLGYPSAEERNPNRYYPEEVWWDSYPGCNWVALPAVFAVYPEQDL